MQVAAVQFSPLFGEIENNIEKAASMIRGKKADLYVLPELAFTGYVFSSRDEVATLAETRDGATVQKMIALAAETASLICFGFPERSAEKTYNSAALVGPEGLIHIYRKIHLFLDELGLLDAGDEPFSIVEVGGVRYGIMICYDWFFPESARSLSLLGAHIILHPANLILPYCQDAMISRSLENRVFTITANRGGMENRTGKTLTFTGRSQITHPDTKFVRLPDASDGVLRDEINPQDAENKNMTRRNHLLKDRRPHLYRLDR